MLASQPHIYLQHPHIFDEQHFVTYEHREDAKDLTTINAEFPQDLIDYLIKNDFTHLIRLKVLDGEDEMVKFVLTDFYTVMLKEPEVNYGSIFRNTS